MHVPRRLLLGALLAFVSLCLLAPHAQAGASAGASSSAFAPVGMAAATEAGSTEPTPVRSTDYDNQVGGPHQDTDVEQTGRAVSSGDRVAILAVVVVTAATVLTLAVRGRRRRTRAAEADGR
ncbi:hypothetical protein [Cellulomonas sp. URHB0016]